MMGYAEEPADFATGRTVSELRTGDLARRRADGMYEIVGRSNRFAKIFGLRLDLDRVERLFADEGLEVRAVESGEHLALFVLADRFVHACTRARRRCSDSRCTRSACTPSRSSRARRAASPTTPHSCATPNCSSTRHPMPPSPTRRPTRSGRCSPNCSGGRCLVDDSFAGLGGDSLSYVEVSLRLEQLLGALPRQWPTMSVRDLAGLAAETAPPAAVPRPARRVDDGAAAPPPRVRTAPPPQAAGRPRRRMPRLETPAVLRAIAIVLVVGTHADLFVVTGGAHLLLAVAGYNLARFQLADVPGRSRVSGLLRSAAQVVIPPGMWIGAVGLITGGYTATTALFVNNVFGGARWDDQWQFWFLEAIVWSMLALAAVFAVPQVDRLERRHPWAFALGVLALAVVARVLLLGGVRAEGTERYAIETAVWCIALGWVVARADDRPAAHRGDGARARLGARLLRRPRARGGRRRGRAAAHLGAAHPRRPAARAGHRLARGRVDVHLPDALAGLPAVRGRASRWSARCCRSSSASRSGRPTARGPLARAGCSGARRAAARRR